MKTDTTPIGIKSKKNKYIPMTLLNTFLIEDNIKIIQSFEDFGIKHTLGINTGIQLSKLINKYGGLHELIVINTNVFVEQMLKMIKLTLNKEYHNCIKVLHNNASFQQKINEWSPTDAQGRTLLETLLC